MTPTTTPPAARVVYISGPMTGLEDYNRPAFHAAAERLAAAGYEPINPAAVTLDPATLGGRDPQWADYMRHHVAVLAQGGVDIVAMLPGWEASRGARLERHLATELGIEVSTVAALLGDPVPLWERPEVVAACLDKLRSWHPAAAPIIEAVNPGGVAATPWELLQLVRAAIQLHAAERGEARPEWLALNGEMSTTHAVSNYIAWVGVLTSPPADTGTILRNMADRGDRILDPMLVAASGITQIKLKGQGTAEVRS